MPYIDQAYMEAMLSAPVVLQLFDDANTGVVNTVALGLVLTRASAKIDGKLARGYGGAFPVAQVPVPQVIQDATFLYAKAYAYERHPEYVKQHGTKPLEAAEAMGEDLANGVEYIPDWVLQPKPKVVGGLVFDPNPAVRTIADGEDGTFNGGDL